MAKIFGLQLKGYKTFEGTEGYGFNANLYFNDRKAASCIDEGDGGEINISWCDNNMQDKVYAEVNRYFKEYPKTLFLNTDLGKLDEFITELIYLSETEKAYKQMLKGGYSVIVNIRYNGRMTPVEEYSFEKEDLQVYYTGWNKSIEKAMKKKYNPVEFNVYKSLADFNIQ